jgi:hypothetical protein
MITKALTLKGMSSETFDGALYIPDFYWDPLPLLNECCDFSDGIVNGQSQVYPPQDTVPQYQTLPADTHLANTKSPAVATGLVNMLERLFVPVKGCTYTLSPTSVTEAASGGKGTFTVSTGSGCAWSVASDALWLTFSPANGTGSGTITYTIAANSGGTRSANLVVAGLATLAVAQNGLVTEALTVTLSGSGAVTSSPTGIACPGVCSAEFPFGTSVTLTGMANLGYELTEWSGCTYKYHRISTCTLTTNSPASVTTTFTSKPPQTLTVNVTGSGTVTSTPSGISCPGTCSASFTYGTTVTLSPSPSSGYILAGWTGTFDTCSGTGACAFVMNAAKNVSAWFDKVTPTIINTVAGDGTAGYLGDGGAATSAELNEPWGVAVDAAGNIYISDLNNSRVRVVNTGTKAVTIAQVVIQPGDIATVAGDGATGYSGDGGRATNAELSYPRGVALDTAGNIYIVDEGNERIRKVTASTGIISTVAGNGAYGYSGDGGAATSAELDEPSGVAADSAGNIYVADTVNKRIRAVNTGTQAVTIAGVVIQPGHIATVAGDGTAGHSGDGGPATSAELYFPFGVALDIAGNIYIADYMTCSIRKVTASTGVISTVAGTNGACGYSGDGGAATSAYLDLPYAVAVDAAGNIYIADTNNVRIREVTASTGIISTVAGDGKAGYSGDGGAATSAELGPAQGVAVDSAKIYVTFANVNDNRIRAFAPQQ